MTTTCPALAVSPKPNDIKATGWRPWVANILTPFLSDQAVFRVRRLPAEKGGMVRVSGLSWYLHLVRCLFALLRLTTHFVKPPCVANGGTGDYTQDE